MVNVVVSHVVCNVSQHHSNQERRISRLKDVTDCVREDEEENEPECGREHKTAGIHGEGVMNSVSEEVESHPETAFFRETRFHVEDPSV